VPHHALEITLTRPLSANALHRAARELPLAANHDATRLMALVSANTPHRAAHRLRHRLGARLPIDVIATHYPDRSGTVLLNVDFLPAAHSALKAAAHRAGQTFPLFVELAVHRALAKHDSAEADRLDRAVQQLLTHTTAPHLLAALGRALTHTPGDTQC
jgi:hypothetical protein